MKKILILSNSSFIVYLFRLELVERLLQEGHDVWILSPSDCRVQDLEGLGCHHIDITIKRHGTNPLRDLILIQRYKKHVKEIAPDIVFSYTIKPNIYGAIACRSLNVPCVVNVSGLGAAVGHKGLLQLLTITMYRFAFTKVRKIYLQNSEDMKFFMNKRIEPDKCELLPGSGVNLERFTVLPYPTDQTIEFAFIARIRREKGIDQFLEMAKIIKKKYTCTKFHVCGFCEEDYEKQLREQEFQGVITYHGMMGDVREILARTHCTVLPTYYSEGLNNVLLESAASGRPIITTNRCGCREVLDDGVNGFVIEQRNTQSLVSAVERFINLTNEERKQMGLTGRKKVEEKFDRRIVVEKYMGEINE